jgi:hypothetical protein
VNKDIWAFKRHDTTQVLQAIWNVVYRGNIKEGRQKIKHLVEAGNAVYEVVWQLVMTLKCTNYSQSVQRASEWRNSVGSTGLSVVGDFMETMGLDTTEARQEAASQLLDNDRYVYLKTKDVVENGVLVVRKIFYICLSAERAQVKRAGRYRGPLVVYTMAQCWVDFEGSVDVPGYVDHDDFPLAALALSATSVSFVCTAA